MLNRAFDVYAFPIDKPEDSRIANLFHDITDIKRHKDHVELLLKEVNHCAKNMLSLVNVIARRTASSGIYGFLERFSDRISALAANQDILVKSEWKTVDLNDLVRGQLAHFSDLFENRIHVDGSPIMIFPEAAEKLGMALHELTTNAGKYGALSNTSGQVQISWRRERTEDRHSYVMEWRETGGPSVKAPQRTGFGSLVSGSLLTSGLGGSVDAKYEPSGLIWRLTCPLASVTVVDDTASVRAEPLTRKSEEVGVLIVDDDALLTRSISEMLEEAGLAMIGPTGNVEDALALIAHARPSFAILDVKRGTETSEPVALELQKQGVPFLCVSGYSKDQLPDIFDEVLFLPKPVDERRILKMIQQQAELKTLEH
ncbi:hypothetical protein P775_16565 [Puniceibacterium antarcticum]|uniref:histidine kinase n=1 Tax=Puniceibacterium antarcticum TaxID=1206336 RepID=A0A2G8RBV8_9RHOB|nr:HWE histidine kinase domain-containing protein [Puniceibacterium antarcticum]PIL19055.1 hypothetical protein P775_16565 [Puniceibacterium antarcticum]